MAVSQRRMRRTSPLGWLVIALGVMVVPVVTIFLINVMFGTSIPITVDTYLLTFAVYIVVFFVVGLFLMAAGRMR